MSEDKKTKEYRWSKEPLKVRQLNKSDLTPEQFEYFHKGMLKGLADGTLKQEDYDYFMNH